MHGYPRNEQMSLEVLFVGKKARRKPIQENKVAVNQGGPRSLSKLTSTQFATEFSLTKQIKLWILTISTLPALVKLPGQSTRILWRLKLSKSCLRAENWRVQIRKYVALCCRQHGFTFRYIWVKEVEKIKVLRRNPCFAWLWQKQVKRTLS